MCSCATCAPSKASAQLRLGVEGFSAVPVLPFTQWPWISLVHSPSQVRDTSPFEQSHGFPARLPLNMDVMEDATAAAAGVCVYYCRTYYKAVRVGEEESGGHVL